MNTEQMDNNYPKIDLFELFRGLLKGCRRMLPIAIVITVVAVAYLGLTSWRNYSPRYEASASFTVRVTNPFYADQQFYNSAVAEQMADTFPYIISSGVMSDHIKETLGIGYMPSVSAEVLGDTNIFTLTVTDGDPEIAYHVLNCVIEEYPSLAEFVIGPTTLSLLNESGIPTEPVNQRSFRSSVVKGCILGVQAWLGLALLYWITHRTINSEEQLVKLVNLPCLGRLPMVRGYGNGKRGGTCPTVTAKNDKFGFNESVRLLRVRMERELAKRKGKVIMVTSSIANEGKTTVSVNLATALAQQGKETLLVDCDLRNPSIAEALGQNSELGFSEYLRGECDLKSIFFRLKTENLYAVFGGKAVSGKEGLLSRKTAEEFLAGARQAFDYVILDTPPSAWMADAAEIGALSDGILLAVRQDFASRQQILEGVQVLGDTGRPIIGCVLNMTNSRSEKGRYSYYGHYGQYGADKSSGVEKGVKQEQ